MTTEESSPNFRVLREDWSEYISEDGSVVRVKAAVCDVIDEGKNKLKIETKNLFFKESTPDDKGESSESLKITKKDVLHTLKFEKVSEPLNVYDLPEKQIVLVKTRLNELKRTSKFDLSGNRIYRYSVQCDFSVTPYPE